MITARQFKSGFAVEINNELHIVMESQHIKPGKGGAFIRAKLKNIQTGAIVERTFRPEDSFHRAYLEEKKMQYLYKDHRTYHFMDQLTYEQLSLDEKVVGETAKFLKDGMEIVGNFHKSNIVEIKLPPFVDLKVTYTEPGIKGDTAKGGSKPATLETGAVIKVPLFIGTNDTVKIDTRTGEYAGRA
ncbi:MAG: elongation factor P [Omnitrophica bacterium RBG_13_46_9]|nr:MAG: elongation factor P [Omnitrophica bacterium RBG_13_46_9]